MTGAEATPLQCHTCHEPLDHPYSSSTHCYACLVKDEQDAELRRFWLAYDRRQAGMLEAIQTVAPRVCSDAELDVLQERLYGLSDDQIAERLNLTAPEVRRREKAAHSRIRTALQAGPSAMLSRRDAYKGLNWRKLSGGV